VFEDLAGFEGISDVGVEVAVYSGFGIVAKSKLKSFRGELLIGVTFIEDNSSVHQVLVAFGSIVLDKRRTSKFRESQCVDLEQISLDQEFGRGLKREEAIQNVLKYGSSRWIYKCR
jgi:hypothetical protein